MVKSGALEDCKCNKGYTGPNGGSCAGCLAGKYKAQTGAAACTDCAAGKYSNATAATSDVCQDCTPNTHSQAGSGNLSACGCNRGYHGRDGNCDACAWGKFKSCLLYTSPSPRDGLLSRMPSSA